jgi:dethiobiotin synthetase
MNGLFITGTDTGVGKTVVAAACMHRFRGSSALQYWKPVQTGIELDDDTATVRRLGLCEEAEIDGSGIRLPRPVSPHLAARLAGERIELDLLVSAFRTAPDGRSRLIEGAGGTLVPLNDTQTMADLIAELGLPVLVVARSALGTINHTLLTLEALRNRSLPVAGVVMTGAPDAENRRAIEYYGNITVVAVMPRLSPLTPETLRAWALIGMDAGGRLLEYLR